MANIAKVVVAQDSLTWNWADGKKTVVKVADFPDVIQLMLTAHGAKQKLADSYSGKKTIAEARVEFDATLDTLLGGEWKRAGGMATGGIWVEAAARASGESLETAQAAWADMDEATRKGVKAHPEVKKAKAEIEAERAAAQVAALSDDDAKPFTFAKSAK